MKYVGYCLGAVALFIVFKLAVVAAGFATGYYLFHVRTPRPHVTMKYIERSPGTPPLACTAAPSAETSAVEP